MVLMHMVIILNVKPFATNENPYLEYGFGVFKMCQQPYIKISIWLIKIVGFKLMPNENRTQDQL